MSTISRREWLTGAGMLAAVSVSGIGAVALAKPAEARKLTMFKSPTCGCCAKWAVAAEAAGFEVEVVPSPEMQKVKARFNVPNSVMSCHTSVIDRYVIEGHVPLDAIKKLLRTQPNVRGIGVAGMPIGTPGMEIPGQPKDDFQVMAFTADGKLSRFA